MELKTLSQEYGRSAQLITRRIRELRLQECREEDPEKKVSLQRRIRDLRPLQEQCRELEKLTAHYYERGYGRNGKYLV